VTLSPCEQSAIASLKRLATRWPPSLMLFSWSGTLCVVKLNEDGQWEGMDRHQVDRDAIVETIRGIRNDGGDPT